MGKYTLTVTSSEDAVYKQNARALIVYLHCEPIADHSDSEAFQAAFLTRFRLKDASGRKYVGAPLPASAVRYMRPGSTLQGGTFDSVAPEEWGVLFPVPQESARFMLHVSNPNRQNGQPAEAAVDLGR